MQEIMHWGMAGLTFLSELALWFGLGRVVWRGLLPSHPKWALAAGVLAAILFVVLWSLFLAPKADRRLSLVPRVLVISAATIITGYLLYTGQDRVYGLVLMIPLTVLLAIGQYVMRNV